LLAEGTLAPAGKPERDAEATPPSESQAPKTRGLQGTDHSGKGERLGARAGDDLSIGSTMHGPRTAAGPYEAGKLPHRCRPAMELRVA
jgi:hypothetical protein